MHAASGRHEPEDVLGRRIHLWFTGAATLVTLAVAHAEAATAIPGERSARTLPLLLASPLRPRRLALGFLASRVLVALTVLAGLLPIEGIALLLGGVSGKDVLLAACAVGTAAVWGAATGLLGGAGAPDARRGLGRAAFLASAWMAIVPLLLWLAGTVLGEILRYRHVDATSADALGWAGAAIFCTTPGGAVFSLLPIGFHLQAGIPSWAALALPGAVAVATAAAAVLAAGRRLAREDDAEIAASARRAGGARTFRSPGAHALAWKESRPLPGAWARWGLRLLLLGWTALLAWLWIDPDVRREIRPTEQNVGGYEFLVSVPLWLLLFSSVASSATLLAEEREKGSLEVLRTTPLSPAAYVLARPAAMLRRLLPAIAVTAAFAGAGLVLGIVTFRGIAAWVLGFALAGPFLVLLGFAGGSRAATVRGASFVTGGITLFLVLGWPMAVGILGWILDWDGLAYVILLDPLASLCSFYVLHAELPGSALSDTEVRRLVVSCAGTLLWAGAAALLWSLRARILDRAFHGRDG